MSTVAIVTNSAADLSPVQAAELGIRIVPLLVRFGTQEFRTGVDLSTADGDPRARRSLLPRRRRRPGLRRGPRGARRIVCVTIGSRLSATFSAEDRYAPVGNPVVNEVDGGLDGRGHLVIIGAAMAAAGEPATAIAAPCAFRDLDLYVAFDTLEYVRKGGRLSATRAASAPFCR